MIAEFFFWFVSDKRRVRVSVLMIIASLIGLLILGGMHTVLGYTFPSFVPYLIGAPVLVLFFLGGPLLHKRCEKEVWETKKTRLFTAGFFLNFLATFFIIFVVSETFFPGGHFSRSLLFQGVSTVFLAVIYTVIGTTLVQYKPQIRL